MCNLDVPEYIAPAPYFYNYVIIETSDMTSSLQLLPPNYFPCFLLKLQYIYFILILLKQKNTLIPIFDFKAQIELIFSFNSFINYIINKKTCT